MSRRQIRPQPGAWVKRSQVADRCPACGRVEVLTGTDLQKLAKETLAAIAAHDKECRERDRFALTA